MIPSSSPASDGGNPANSGFIGTLARFGGGNISDEGVDAVGGGNISDEGADAVEVFLGDGEEMSMTAEDVPFKLRNA